MANESIQNQEEDIFTLEINNATSVIIEDSKKVKNSPFKDIYNNFFDILNKEIKNIENPPSFDECPNNIFAFVGERGTGKTSCMKSVAKMLEKNELPPVDTNKKEEEAFKNINEKKFEVLESTDPSFFDATKNILEIFLGHLFAKFNQKVKEKNNHDIGKKNDVLQDFENVKHALSCLGKNNICEDSSVDQLIDLSVSVDLQANIRKLINNFLEYINKDFLVIPVDDIDLHSVYAYNMAEQIRKYLIQPKTIILMALKMEQMESVIEQHYLNHYQKMLDRGLLQISSISNMATRYLIKLIPQSHRITLKSIEDLLNGPVKITLNGNDIKFKETLFKYIITDLIFEKTRFLFYNFSKEPSLIIPRNLRECIFLLEFLIRMETSEKDAPRRKNNQKNFIHYILNSWSHCLNDDEQKILRNLYYNTDARHLNKAIIQALKSKLVELKDSKSFPSHINKIASFNSTPYNISTGDVFVYINYYESKIFQENDKLFIFAIKTLYAIKLYDFYNEKTDYDKSNSELTPILNKLDNIPNYNILAGGSFISEADDQINEHYNINKLEYDQSIRRIISLQDIKDEFEMSIKDSKDIDFVIFNTIEFFALTTSRSYSFSNDESFRVQREPVYNEEYSERKIKHNPYVWFDIFSIFFNITQIEQCYNRIHPDLFNIAQKYKNSLLNKINKISKDEKPYCKKNDNHALLSCSCIRNFDVLEKIRYELITETLSDGDPEDDDICTLLTILNICQNFSIKTYDPKYNDEKSRYEINFKFAKILYDFLNKKGKNETFERIYNTVSQKTDAFLVKVENWKNNLSKSKSKNDNINDLKEIIKTTKDSQFYIEEDFKEAFKGVDVHNPNNSDLEDAYQTFFDELLNYPVIA